jgi:hypothetical protein
MNIKQATQMLDQIKKSDLHSKTKVAQELVRELELYIRSAGMKKQADLRLIKEDENSLLHIFAYWATASLLKLKELGEPSLQSLDILEPHPGDKAIEFGSKVMRGLRRKNAHAVMVNDLYEKVKNNLKIGIDDTYSNFIGNNRRYNVGTTLEDLWLTATSWSMSHNTDVIDRVEEGRTMRSDAYVFPSIQKKTQRSSSVAESVMDAIKKGVFNVMSYEGRFLTQTQRIEFGVVKNEGGINRPVGLEVSKGDETFDNPGLARKQVETYSKNELNEMTDEELERLKARLISGEFDDEDYLYEKLVILNQLVKNGNLKSGHEYFETLYDDFSEGRFDGDLKDAYRDILVEVGELTLSTADGLDLLSRFEAGEFDEDLQLKEEMKENLIESGWVINNIEPSIEAQEAADMIVETAEERAEAVVDSMDLGEGELQEVVEEKIKLDLQIVELEKLSKLFSDDQFHWMIDSNLYLKDDEWAYAIRYFNKDAMVALQNTIKEHQAPLLPVGLRYILNSQTFIDEDKVKAIKKFADNCMDVSKLFLSDTGPFSWYVECAILLNGGSLKFDVAGSEKEVTVDSLTYFIPHTIGTLPNKEKGFYDLVKMMSEKEREELARKIDQIVKPIIPKASKMNGQMWVEKLANQKDRNQAIKIVGKGAKGGNKLRAFFGAIASELVRYRFYLDLGLTESTSPLVPKGLGKVDCDNTVRSLMGPIPTSTINEVKEEIYNGEVLTQWGKEVQDALNARVRLKWDERRTFNNQAKELFKALGIKEDTELYQAFMDLD